MDQELIDFLSSIAKIDTGYFEINPQWINIENLEYHFTIYKSGQIFEGFENFRYCYNWKIAID